MGLTQAMIEMFGNSMTPKFLATSDAEGTPNVVPITSLTVIDQDTLIFGDFLMWKTERNLEVNPKVGVLVLTEGLEYVYLKGAFQGFVKYGPYMDTINAQDMFRYNAYTGIRQAGVIKVEAVGESGKISKSQMLANLVWLKLQGTFRTGLEGSGIMPRQVAEKFSRINALKVCSYLGEDGYPFAFPALPMLTKGESQISFVLPKWVASLKKNTPMAACVLTMEPICYQVKGIVKGQGKIRDIALTDVYSACPPLVGKKIG